MAEYLSVIFTIAPLCFTDGHSVTCCRMDTDPDAVVVDVVVLAVVVEHINVVHFAV